MHVRRDVWALEREQKWHPVTLAYAKAIATLQQRPATDPTSWTYQAAIHSTAATPERPGWNQCQHGGWFFLPWHRLYLYYFERIIRSVVVASGGSEDWALPYWNYDASRSAALPTPFRRRKLPDGSPNPLYISRRRAGINTGRTRLPAEITSPAAALAMSSFAPPPNPGFGGGQTTFEHFWSETGGLEQTPHNDVHVAVGGPGGLMTDPDTAALDPIFWLHHSNIDRLWNVWRASGSNANPSGGWLDQTFQLFDRDGSPVTNKIRDVLDSGGQLDYQYDDEAHAEAAEAPGGRAVPAAGGTPEMIGASEQPITLAGSSASVDVEVDSQARTEALAPEAASPRRLYLSIEHIESDQPHGTVYGVYVQAPGGARRRVGNVSVFGAHKIRQSRAGGDQDHGLRLVYDVTDLASELGGAGLAGKRLRVTFEPLAIGEPAPPAEAGVPGGAAAEAAPSTAEASPVRIGRISFFTQ